MLYKAVPLLGELLVLVSNSIGGVWTKSRIHPAGIYTEKTGSDDSTYGRSVFFVYGVREVCEKKQIAAITSSLAMPDYYVT